MCLFAYLLICLGRRAEEGRGAQIRSPVHGAARIHRSVCANP